MKPIEAYKATRTFPSLGVRRALALWKNDVHNAVELSFMTDTELLEMPGIDRAALTEIRLSHPIESWTKAQSKRIEAMLEEVSMTDKDEAPQE